MRKSPQETAQKLAHGLFYILLFAIPFSVAAIEIIFPLIFLAWIIGWHWKNQEPSLWNSPIGKKVLYSLLVYTIVCAWSVTLSSYPVLSLEGLIGKTFEYSLFFIIASEVVNSPRVYRRCVQMLVAASFLVGIYAVLQQMIGFDPIRHRALAYHRMVGPYLNPNDLATFLMVMLLFIGSSILATFKRVQRGRWVLAALLLFCIFKTLSRGAFLGLVPAFLFLLILYPLPRRMRFAVGMGLLAVGTLVVLRKASLSHLFFLTDAGTMERRTMWDTAWRMIRAHPVVGLGVNTFMANYLHYVADANQGPAYAHNCFLQIAAETGVVGLISFLAFLGFLFSSYWMAMKKMANLRWASLKPWLLGLMAGLMAFLIQSAFDTNLYSLRHATLFWVLAGVAFGMSQLVTGRRKDDQDDNFKIVRIITRLNVGGPAQHVVSLSEQMSSVGWETTLVAGEVDKSEGNMKYLLSDKVRFCQISSLQRSLYPVKDVKAFFVVLRILFQERPRILHTHTAKAGAIGRSAGIFYRWLTGVPLVIVHTFHGHVLSGYFNCFATGLFCLIERLLGRLTDRIVTVSASVKSDLVKLKIASSSKIEVIPLAPHLDPFLAIEPSLFDNSLSVGVVGRLTAIKNHELLLRAVGLLQQANQLDHTQFLFVGDGELKEALKEYARKMGVLSRIQFLGWRSDLPALYRSIHLVCLTSRNEGTPVAVMEALAAARPVVATDVGGVRGLLGGAPRNEPVPKGTFEMGQRGVLVPSEDEEALSKALVFLMTHPETSRQMGSAGRQFVLHQMDSYEQLIENYDKLYRRLMRR